jgi:hypothetical protein
MSPKNIPAATVRVLSQDCTHILSDQGLVLEGGAVTEIPAQHLARVLALPGVVQVDFEPTPEKEN